MPALYIITLIAQTDAASTSASRALPRSLVAVLSSFPPSCFFGFFAVKGDAMGKGVLICDTSARAAHFFGSICCLDFREEGALATSM